MYHRTLPPPGVVYTHQYSSSLLRQHKVLAEARDLVMHELVEEMVVVYVMEAMIEEEEDEASQTIRARTASPQKMDDLRGLTQIGRERDGDRGIETEGGRRGEERMGGNESARNVRMHAALNAAVADANTH